MSGPSEFRRNWAVLVGSMILIACGMNSLYFYSVGLFIKPISQDLHLGRERIALGVTAAALTGVFAAPLIGKLLDRFGPRAVVVWSLFLFGLSFEAAGLFANNLQSFL